MIETNLTSGELEEKAKALLKAAHDFWIAHQTACGLSAVVWLRDTSGHFVLFTRGEYQKQIMENIEPIVHERPMSGAFERTDK